MAPRTINNPPSPAKGWSKERKRDCVRAANAVLQHGGSDEDAVYACIHAAKTKQGPEEDTEYERAVEDGIDNFQTLVALYFAGSITLNVFRDRFEQNLTDHYIRIMLLAIGDSRDVTDRDLNVLQEHVDNQLTYLGGFVDDLDRGRMSEQRALWRAGLYSFARSAFVNFSIPLDIAGLMSVLPGDDCLGGDLCGCYLTVDYDDDGTAYVYWNLDPAKESCEVCIAHAIESPFVFTVGDQSNALS